MNRFVCAICAFALTSTPVLALDDKRAGFIIGGGLGFHSVNVDFQANGSSLSSASESGLASSFRIGGGFNEQVTVYYMREASWYRADDGSGSQTTYAIGMAGVGLSYYLSKSKESVYLIAGVGFGDRSAISDASNPDVGTAWLAGVGYELKQHLSVEGKYLSADIESADLSSINLQTSSPMVTLNYTWY